MTDEERAELNQALVDAGLRQVVWVSDEGEKYLCNVVKTQKIDDIIAFGEIYGVTIAP